MGHSAQEPATPRQPGMVAGSLRPYHPGTDPVNLTIARLSFASSLVLAPLAGYSDLAFRLLCKSLGAGLGVSEMISAHGVVYQQQKTLALLKSCADERPVSCQLFGSDPAIMGEAAAILSTYDMDLLDINMGCPVKKVTKRGAGAALMSDFRNARKIIIQVTKNSKYPVTVKFRSGPDAATINVVDFAKMAQDHGAEAVAVHGRTWQQAFTGRADWNVVKSVKNAVHIPVIGNGDIVSYAEAMTKISQDYCDGVMIGRGALGNPWVFSQNGRPEELSTVKKYARTHVLLFLEHIPDPQRKIFIMKNHLGRYFKGFPGSSMLRKAIYEASNFAELLSLLSSQHRP